VSKQGFRLLCFVLMVFVVAQAQTVSVTTLNCYAFFGGGETHMELGQPKSSPEYWTKAQNLVSLWPTNPPLVVALEEIGGAREAVYLSRFAAQRYQHAFQPVFAETKDTFTEEAVGAMIDLSQGWKISGKPGRVAALDKDLSKHLVIMLTNNFSQLQICIVHLRRAIGQYGVRAQQNQNLALKHWAESQLAANPRANVILLGDFNETKNPGDAASPLAPVVVPAGPLRDTFSLAGGTFRTHANGRAYDRILISDALEKGAAGWKFETVSVQPHRHGKGDERKLFTDHFPVTAVFDYSPKK
jgi:endonuclease/exonuclease/phosphatase family metal-dependent hydrolase